MITEWVVRDVYDGIALGGPRLIESRREDHSGAGMAKSIERRSAGWIVITSRGLVDPPAQLPALTLAASPGLASPLDAMNFANWYRHPGSNGGPLDPQSSALTN